MAMFILARFFNLLSGFILFLFLTLHVLVFMHIGLMLLWFCLLLFVCFLSALELELFNNGKSAVVACYWNKPITRTSKNEFWFNFNFNFKVGLQHRRFFHTSSILREVETFIIG